MSTPSGSGPRFGLPARLLDLRRSKRIDPAAPATEPPFDPASWSGALIVMVGVAAVLWVIQIVNATQNYEFDRFGIKPREVDGLWGVLTAPFLHASYAHLLSNTVPLIGVGWVLLMSGVRVWLFVTAVVVIVGDAATWVVAPSGVIVGASGMIFGWLGYLVARAYFTRRLKWILVAIALLIFFGTLLGSVLPTVASTVSWQAHLCGLLTGVAVGWLLHPRRPAARGRTRRSASAVS